MNLKEFIIYFGVIVGLGNTLVMLWTLYNIYITDGHFVRAEVMVGEPNMWILIPEIAMCIFGVFMMSMILYNNKFKIMVQQ